MILLEFGFKFLSLLSTSKKSSISGALVIGLLFTLMVLKGYAARYYSTSDNDIAADFLNDYTDNLVRTFYNTNPKRSRFSKRCLKRGMPCDHRPDDCCTSSLCRCNLWGTNCRCKRIGLLQRWG